MASAPQTVALQGVVSHVVFRNPETGFSVVRLDVEDKRELVVAVGLLLSAREGDMVRVEGHWKDDPKFGRQIAVASWTPVRPETLEGLERYLGSGLVEGFGPGLAQALVGHFGKDTLMILDKRPDRLVEVAGVGAKRAAKLQAAWERAQGDRELQIFLQSVGLKPRLAARVVQRYGRRTTDVVKTEPYRLALEVAGVGFATADALAQRLGFAKDAPGRIEAGLAHELAEAATQGHTDLPKELLVEKASKRLGVHPDIVQPGLPRLELAGHVINDAEHIYLTQLYDAETRAVECLQDLLDRKLPGVEAKKDATAGIELSPSQTEALRGALEHAVFVVTGGPGTGKTTLVQSILRSFSGKALLAAPTGRAAKRLSEATAAEAKTLHRLLEYDPQTRGFARDASRPLEADLVVVDECSMLDIELFASLVDAIGNKCRLLLVGDDDQLPSVGPGRVLGDLLSSGRVPSTRLSRVFRQAAGSAIVAGAHRVRDGEMPELPDAKDEETDFHFVVREDPEAALQVIRSLVATRIPRKFDFNPVRDIQVLAPMHRGSMGVARLNDVLRRDLNPTAAPDSRVAVGDKVLQMKNDYDLHVFNGDLGQVVDIAPKGKKVIVRFDDREVRYDGPQSEALALAYATSIHKSQGSEYPAVVLGLHTQHWVMLHRNLLYTAITRARRLLVGVGSKRALERAVQHVEAAKRNTRLAQRLEEACVSAISSNT